MDKRKEINILKLIIFNNCNCYVSKTRNKLKAEKLKFLNITISNILINHNFSLKINIKIKLFIYFNEENNI
jgi:hypothetical protein